MYKPSCLCGRVDASCVFTCMCVSLRVCFVYVVIVFELCHSVKMSICVCIYACMYVHVHCVCMYRICLKKCLT